MGKEENGREAEEKGKEEEIQEEEKGRGEGKHNYVADHLSRPVQIISRTTEATWLGLNKEAFQIKQREELVWEELMSYLEGGKVPTKRLPKTTLDQFALQDGL